MGRWSAWAKMAPASGQSNCARSFRHPKIIFHHEGHEGREGQNRILFCQKQPEIFLASSPQKNSDLCVLRVLRGEISWGAGRRGRRWRRPAASRTARAACAARRSFFTTKDTKDAKDRTEFFSVRSSRNQFWFLPTRKILISVSFVSFVVKSHGALVGVGEDGAGQRPVELRAQLAPPEDHFSPRRTRRTRRTEQNSFLLEAAGISSGFFRPGKF